MTDKNEQSLELPIAPAASAKAAASADADAEIHSVVNRFYVLVRADELLGPIFDEWVTDWPVHLQIMEDFWSSAVHRTGRYSGRPIEVHRKIPNLRQEQFDRWFALWSQAVEESVRPELRSTMTTLARRMSDAMSLRLLNSN